MATIERTFFKSVTEWQWVVFPAKNGDSGFHLDVPRLPGLDPKYLRAVAAELRLPIVVANPAPCPIHRPGFLRSGDETKALTATRARQLMGLPQGYEVNAFHDRAILRFCLHVGVRIGTACRMRAQDFHVEGDEATIRIAEKGDKRRTIGIHFAAAEAIGAYMKNGNIESGSLSRPRSGPHSLTLANRHMTETAMYILIM